MLRNEGDFIFEMAQAVLLRNMPGEVRERGHLDARQTAGLVEFIPKRFNPGSMCFI
jgi:hypothetical protein